MVIEVLKCGAIMGSIGPIAHKDADDHGRNDVTQMVVLSREEVSFLRNQSMATAPIDFIPHQSPTSQPRSLPLLTATALRSSSNNSFGNPKRL